MSQKELADFLGLSKSTVGLYETGDTLPDAQALGKMAEYFCVNSDYLLCLTDAKPQDMELQQICDRTGLSEKAVKQLIAQKAEYKSDTAPLIDRITPFMNTLAINGLLEDDKYCAFVYYLAMTYFNAMKSCTSSAEYPSPLDDFTASESAKDADRHGYSLVPTEDAIRLYLRSAFDVMEDIITNKLNAELNLREDVFESLKQ